MSTSYGIIELSDINIGFTSNAKIEFIIYKRCFKGWLAFEDKIWMS